MRVVVLSVFLALAACAEQGLQSGQSNPDRLDRTAWEGLPVTGQAAHARALQVALETPDPTPIAWSSGNASGEVLILGTSDLTKRPVCRTFSDRITVGDQTVDGTDAACWADGGWIYMIPGPARAVITPAYVAGDRTYVVRRRSSTIDRIARRSKTNADDLRKLNPLLPRRIPRGTTILLP